MKQAVLPLLLAAALVLPAAAQHSHPVPAAPAAAQAPAKDLAEGEVRKVDKAAGKIILKHG
jgi:Cu/Ag efflux protein CusF